MTHVVAFPTARPEPVWFGRIQRLALLAWPITLLAVAFGLVAGWITLTTGIGGERGDWTGPGYRPPLFFVISNFMYAVAVVLSLPVLLVAVVRTFRGSYARAGLDLLRAVAPAAVWVAFAIGSHDVGCAFAALCRNGSFTGQSHLFHHTAVAGLPAALVLTVTNWMLAKFVENRVPAARDSDA